MTDDFDDQALRDAIGARAGGPVHAGDARQAIVARATRTRTIRSAAIGGTATFGVVVGLVLIQNTGDTPGVPADQPAAPVATSATITPPPATTVRPTDATSMTSAPSTSITPTPTTAIAAATSTPADTATTAPSGVAPTTLAPATQPTPAPTAEPTSTSPPSTTTTPPTIPTTSTTPDPSDPPFTRRYDSLGGSITIDWDGSALTLVATAANDGYETEIEDQSADKVRVRFRGDDDDSRIEVRVRDGQVEHTVS